MEKGKIIEAIQYISENGCMGINCSECPLNEQSGMEELCSGINSIGS